MHLSIVFSLCVVGLSNAAPDRRDALSAFKGRTEIHSGHAPAKDYIVIEVLKPIVHYFAASARVVEAPARPLTMLAPGRKGSGVGAASEEEKTPAQNPEVIDEGLALNEPEINAEAQNVEQPQGNGEVQNEAVAETPAAIEPEATGEAENEAAAEAVAVGEPAEAHQGLENEPPLNEPEVTEKAQE